MKKSIVFLFCLSFTIGYAQSLPIDFESGWNTANFEDFSGGMAMVVDNPLMEGENASETVAQIVRNGGEIWAGSKLVLAENLDFSSFNTITMKVLTSAPVGTVVKFKLEGDGTTERDVTTTVSNEWEVLTWDFTGAAADYNTLAFMFDFGNTGDGSESSTFYFDDVAQLFGGTQIDLPVEFEGATVNYTTTDFGGNVSSLVTDPEEANNTVVQVIKTAEAATWAGTTIGTPAGFATDIPLTLSDSKMTVRVWSPEAGTPIRLKVEDSDDPRHTCETETNTTLDGAWETLEFDFTNQAPGTELLSIGLDMGWTYNMASIFFNFDTSGQSAGEKTYYFDDVRFGPLMVGTSDLEVTDLAVFPNPTTDDWTITTEGEVIRKITLYDINGKLILSRHPDSTTFILSASHLPKGIYITDINSRTGTSRMRLVKR